MELQEYHVKRIFKQAGLPVLKGEVAYTPEDALIAAKKMGKGPYFLKAQIVGGSTCYGELLTPDCKAEGCAFVTDKTLLTEVAKELFGHPDWVNGTDTLFEVKKIYVEQGVTDATIVGRLIFRVNFEKQCRMLTIASQEGKMVSFELDAGLDEETLKRAVRAFNVTDEKVQKSLINILKKAYKLFQFYGAVAVELSPIVRLKDDSLKVIDGRLVFDPNATYKFPELIPLIESRIGKEREKTARENHFRYLGLKGNIACVVNGIGLGWATIDLVQHKGGKVAALLDIGTEPTKETVTKALRLVLSEPNVDAILVNIFGGATRCDLIAEGLIAASPEMATGLPLVVRMDGINADVGQRLLFESRLPVIVKTKMDDAARAVVKAVKEKR